MGYPIFVGVSLSKSVRISYFSVKPFVVSPKILEFLKVSRREKIRARLVDSEVQVSITLHF